MNYTINSTKPVIIGIDHGYGNIKTAHTCFKTGVTAYNKEPTFKSDLLIYEDRHYIIGDEHKEFTADKMTDQDYYILTLAAIARELNSRGLTSADVFLAVGLPLTWVSEQKDSFKAYLLRSKEVSFSCRGKSYRVTFAGAAVHRERHNEHHVYQQRQADPQQVLHREVRHPSVYAGRPRKADAEVRRDRGRCGDRRSAPLWWSRHR